MNTGQELQRSSVESLEARRLFNGSFIDGNGKLTVPGTDVGDTINIDPVGNEIEVEINGNAMRFPAGDVTGIVVNAGGGGDEVTNNTDKPSTLNGGSGNDTLRGGSGNDTVNGDGGDDDCMGNGGNDLVNGGADSDECYGGADKDTLDGGTGPDDLWGGGDDDKFINLQDGSPDRCFGGDGTGDTAPSYDPEDTHDVWLENWGTGYA